MRQLISIFCLATLLSVSALASAQNIEHGLWLDLSIADIEETTNEPGAFTSELNDTSTGHLAISYEIKFGQYFALGAGYISGDSDEVEFFLDWFTDTEVDYNSRFAAAKFHLPLSDRHSLFVDINHHDYKFEVSDDSEVIERQEGSDIGYVFGWRAEFNDRLGLQVGREVLPLGDDLTVKGAKVGLRYQF